MRAKELAAPRVVASCVAENRPDFARKVENLLLSRRFAGGTLARAPFVVNVVDEVDQPFADRIEELGAEVRVVPRLALDGFGLANKLRMLELSQERDFDLLLAIDCDVVLTGDPVELLPRSAVGAAPADRNPLTQPEWRRLFAGLGIADQGRPLHATVTGRRLPPYFNSGVLCVPHALSAALLERWLDALRRLEALWAHPRAPIAPHKRFYSEQWALMAALDRLPWRALPADLNFPTHVRAHRHALGHGHPRVLHYHAELDARGFLRRPATPVARDVAERFNALRADALGLPYTKTTARPVLSANAQLAHRRLYRALGSRGWNAVRRMRG